LNHLLKPLLAAFFLLSCSLASRAQQLDARAIVEKAIKAHGRTEQDKFRAARFKTQGTAYQGEMAFKFTEEEVFQDFDKIKSVQEIKFDTLTITYTLGFDGKQAWIKAKDPMFGLEESELNLTAHILNELYFSRVTGLTSLLKFQARPVDAKIVDDQKCAALIRLLGHDSFAAREKASQDLVALGNAAVPSLERAQKSSDLEVARRAERCLSVICSKDIYFDLALLPEVLVDKKPATGVSVRSRGHKDINLYFDKQSNLLVKVRRRFDDPMTGEATDEERTIQEFQDIQGIKTSKKVVVFRNGKKYIDMELVEAKYLEKVDDREFAKP